MRIGQRLYMPKHILIGGKKTRQVYKIEITKKIGKKQVRIVMHHYKTRVCNKVSLQIPKKLIRKYAIKHNP